MYSSLDYPFDHLRPTLLSASLMYLVSDSSPRFLGESTCILRSSPLSLALAPVFDSRPPTLRVHRAPTSRLVTPSRGPSHCTDHVDRHTALTTLAGAWPERRLRSQPEHIQPTDRANCDGQALGRAKRKTKGGEYQAKNAENTRERTS